MNTSDALAAALDRWRGRALVAGIVGFVLMGIAWLISPQLFFRSYLFAYLFWLGISVGSLAILMLHHMVGGGWGFVIRRVLEASTRTLPLMALLFLPLLLGLDILYEWARPEVMASDHLLHHKAPYLNVPFFLVRVGIFFSVWILLSQLLNRKSAQQDETGDPAITRKLQLISGPGLVALGATVTFASVDWAMSLEPHWFSTLYGLLFLEGMALTTMAFSVFCLRLLREYEPLASYVTAKHFHDLGNLLLAFVMLWAYLNFSQYLIVWSGNLPEEIPWYLNRTHGGWEYVALILVVLHFALPFVLLLSRTTKRRMRTLGLLAGSLLLLRLLDLFFMIIPGVEHHADFNVQWTDLVAPLAIGGVWLGFFAANLKSRALLPEKDPRLSETFAEGAVDHG